MGLIMKEQVVNNKPKINTYHQKFIRRLEKLGYDRHPKLDSKQVAHLTKYTTESKRKGYRFHLLLYVYENTINLHREDIGNHKNVITDLRDDDLRSEFDKVHKEFFQTVGRHPSIPCPLCNTKLKPTKIVAHIEAECCSDGYDQLIDQLGSLDNLFFGGSQEDKYPARQYYKKKYGVDSRSLLTSEQIEREINIRKKQLNSNKGGTVKEVLKGGVALGAGIAIERLRKK